MSDSNEGKISELAAQIMGYARDSILVNLRFMDSALNKLEPVTYSGTIATEGRHLFYDPRFILLECKKQDTLPARYYLHILFHCIFRHMFVSPDIQRDIWDLACDIAVENAINELELDMAASPAQSGERSAVYVIKASLKKITAEKIYRYLIDTGVQEANIKNLSKLFRADDHSMWYDISQAAKALGILSKEKKSDSGENKGYGDGSGDGLDDLMDGISELLIKPVDELDEEDWKKISEMIEIAIQNFQMLHGRDPSSFVQNINEVNRERYDYTEFLKKFSVLGEVMKINNDEFDTIFYTYGLSMYDNMPLIEPLEYKEERRIKEFVIAIDTSGSVRGELVQKFIAKTYNILMQGESFFSKINIHIIQCDADIQEDTKITCTEEFEEYIRTVDLHGFGGTDFRPVFRYVEALRKNGDIKELGGLIYFTDGYGTFPKNKPDYNTAFVFVGEDDNNVEVPVWAIKLVLPQEDINDFKIEDDQ